jgi:hypothetical protein
MMQPVLQHRFLNLLRSSRPLAIGLLLGIAAYLILAVVVISKMPAVGGMLVLIAVGGIGGVIAVLIIREELDKEEQRSQFRYALCQRLGAISHQPFDFPRFVAETGISRGLAAATAEQLYSEFFQGAVADGVLAQAEIAMLNRIASSLAIAPNVRVRIEAAAKESKYQQALQAALSDGVLSDAESEELSNLRRCLGMASQDVRRATGRTGEESYRILFNQIVAKGPISQADAMALADRRRAMGLSGVDAFAVIRQDALALYRQRFYQAKQDGQITLAEEQELANLQQFLGLDPKDVERYQQEIRRIKCLAAIRAGNLPAVRSSKLLEGGEICHWDTPCRHAWRTQIQTKEAVGSIIVTNKRIVFTSALRSFEFRPVKIVDIVQSTSHAELQTSGSRGTGAYSVNDVEAFVATLEAVTKKQKFLLAENFSSTRSRHIPPLVKQEVWTRDGGRCAQRNAEDYLEFDHIIPHSRGGANTVNNIQVLCRRCNGLKSDRI